MSRTGFTASLRRELRQLTGHRMYLYGIVLVPMLLALFFVTLLSEGLPLKVPTAVVDLDQSQLSRQVTRSLGASELIDINDKCESFHEAMQKVQRGDIYGFFYIPEDFERDALSGRTPTLSYYSNMTYYVPGTLAFKGFKTMAVTTSGGIVQTTLVSTGAFTQSQTAPLLQPVVVDTHAPGNPWTNYSYYLSPSFIAGVLQLMIFLMTAWSVCHEIKTGTSRGWLQTAGGSVTVAVAEKLLPQTVLFTLMTWWCDALMYGYCHFPLNCPLWHMLLAGVLFVVASQGFMLFICCIVPNLRLSLSIGSLTGILSFSLAAFSFPVASMYGSLGIFAYVLPVRYYFLIFTDQALNGVELYYSRGYYIALIAQAVVGMTLIWRLKRRALNPVYVP